LTAKPDLVALSLAPKDAARLVQRGDVVPAGWIAFVERASRTTSVMPAGADLSDVVDESLTFFRAGPIPISFLVRPVYSADGIEMSSAVTLRVSLRPDMSDLRQVRGAFTKRGKPEVVVGDLEAYLGEQILVAARVFGRGRSAADLAAAGSGADFADHLSEALQRPLLSAGLALVPGMIAKFRLLGEAPGGGEAMGPQAREASGSPAAGQKVLHDVLLSQISGLARTAVDCGEDKVAQALRKLREKVEGQTAFTQFEQVARVLPERIRTELYGTLLKLWAAEPAEYVAAAAGGQAVCWRLADPAEPCWVASVPADLGGVRSVRLCRGPESRPWLLVGSQRGVAILDAETGRLEQTLREPHRGASAGGGFNAALVRGRQCWASKSDLGLLCWDLDRPDAPWVILSADSKAEIRFVRAATLDASGAVWFAADNWLIQCSSSLATAPQLNWFVPVDGAATCIEADGEDLWIGTQGGSLWQISLFDPRGVDLQEVCQGQAVEAIAIRRTGPVRWLIYADGRAAIVRSVDGSYRREFFGRSGIRAAKSAGQWVVGLSDWRDDVFLWDACSSGAEPIGLNVQRVSHSRVQDFDVA